MPRDVPGLFVTLRGCGGGGLPGQWNGKVFRQNAAVHGDDHLCQWIDQRCGQIDGVGEFESPASCDPSYEVKVNLFDDLVVERPR